MIVGAIFIPKNLADLLNLIRSQSSYLTPFRKTPGSSHLVLIGDFNLTSLRAFLSELYNKVWACALKVSFEEIVRWFLNALEITMATKGPRTCHDANENCDAE